MKNKAYPTELARMIREFLKARRIECIIRTVMTVNNTFIFIFFFKNFNFIFSYTLYILIIVELIAFYQLYSVDQVLKPRFEKGCFLFRNTEKKLFMEWAKKKNIDQKAQELINQFFMIEEE